jgi:hypothetical protein
MDEPESGSGSERVLPIDFIAHHGIKGMHWGVQKSEGSGGSSGAKDVVVKPGRDGKKVKTTGGNKQPASADAVNAAVSKRMALKSSTDSLSTKQLQEMVNRMNLEQQYSRLEKDSFRSKSGTKFATEMVKQHGAEAVLVGGSIAIKKNPALASVSALNKAMKVAAFLKENKGKKKKK